MDFQERPGEYSLGHFACALEHYVTLRCERPPDELTIRHMRDWPALTATVYVGDFRHQYMVDRRKVEGARFDLLAAVAERVANELALALLAGSTAAPAGTEAAQR